MSPAPQVSRGTLASRLRGCWPILLIFVLALALRLWGLRFDMPYFVMQPDEEQVVVRALRFGYGDLNPHWFLYPTLYLYLTFFMYAVYYFCGLAAGFFHSAGDFGAAFFRDPTLFYLLPRTLSAVCGAATVVPVYLSAEKMFGRRRYAIPAALFMAVSFYHVKYSHFAKPDAVMTFLLSMAFLFCVRYYRHGLVRDSLLAGLFAGMSISVKYPAGMIMLPLAIAHLFSSCVPLGRRLRMLACSAAVLGATFLAGTPYAILDYSALSDWLGWMSSLKTAICRGQEYPGVYGYSYYLLHAWPKSSGHLLWAASAAGFLAAFRNYRNGLLLLSFPAAFLAYMGNSYTFLDSYFLPCIPFMSIAAGLVVGLVADAMKSVRAAAALAILVALPSAGASLEQLYHYSTLNTLVMAKFWVEHNVRQGAKILSTINNIPPLNLNTERLRQLSREPSQKEKALGPSAGDTGRGAYRAYFEEHPRYPSYYYTGIHLREADDAAAALAGFDFKEYKDYDYIIVVPAAVSSVVSSAPPVMVPSDMAGHPERFYAAYYRFLSDVEKNSELAADIGNMYYNEAFEHTPGGKYWFGLWGRPGPRILIYKVRKRGLK